MTAPSNAELREAILWAIKSQFEGLDCSHLGHKDEEAARLPNQALENATDELAALFQAREQQIMGLTETDRYDLLTKKQRQQLIEYHSNCVKQLEQAQSKIGELNG